MIGINIRKKKKTATVPKKPRQINQTKKQKEIMIAGNKCLLVHI